MRRLKQMKTKNKFPKLFKINEIQTLVLGFLIIILLGAVLLHLPISSTNRAYTSFIDSLFVSTSATCVTGLVTVDTGNHWSYFGKVVIMILIQVGGLGFMSFSTLFALIIGRKITLKERMIIHESLNSFNLQGLVKMSKYILIFTFLTEFIGAAILSFQFIPQFGFIKGLFFSVFHSISAFCNAGIDLFGDGKSLTSYHNNTLVIFTISSLIIIGGLGFYVWQELWSIFYSSKRVKLSLHSKVVLITTCILIVSGAVLFFIFERNNTATIGNMSTKGKIMSCIFASITPRTAGFNSISLADINGNSKLLTMILMFIGGSPGSTAGGIKTTTIAIIILTVLSIISGRENTEICNRTINKNTVYKSLVVLSIGIIVVFVSSIMLSITESGITMESILFESVSAFGTVGLSLGITPDLTSFGKLIISMVMFLGRLGGLTIVLSIVKRTTPNSIKYPKGRILIG
ncbi:TrkH family potassium uptake protein [Clostridium sp. AWRP]|uniref:TrkH family potassium uptake protein n=1 Tax=Clostridium sp. AWRP TaxID=2212991 RepID=UPI00325A775F